MSAHEHCPSKKELHQAVQSQRALERAAGSALPADPQKPWRSLDEVADTAEFRDFLEREFPAGASELREETTRRDFLKIMGASVALAGAATIPGCRRPDHKIMPYSAVVPEDVIPGKPMFYATSMALPGGGAEGLLVETHEGRPTKIEGNPFHPINRGKSSVWAQAAILGIYDPDRLKYPLYRGAGPERAASWEDFKRWSKDHFSRFDTTRGQGLAVIVDKKTSITREAMRQRFMQRYPQAVWVAYDATENAASVRGTQLAFGSPMRERLTISNNGQIAAKVIVSFDHNFLEQEDAANLVHQRQFAATRRPLKAEDGMSRLYVVEPGFSLTGSCADHRLRMAPSRIPAIAVMLARAVLERVGPQQDAAALVQAVGAVQMSGDDLGGETAKFVSALADDLIAEDLHGAKHNRVGETLILAGPTQPAEVHALCYALNQVLGNIGKTISFTPMDPESASNSGQSLAQLVQAMAAGTIDTLVCIEANPIYNAPPALDFAAAFKKVPNTITLSCSASETAAASMWALNGTHFLESWGDTVAQDGTVAPIQPMIAPLYGPSFSEIEFLAMLADPNAGIAPPAEEPATPPIPGQSPTTPPQARVDDGHRILREAWATFMQMNVTSPEFDKAFKRALHDGVLNVQPPAPTAPAPNFAAIAQALAQFQIAPTPTQQALDAFFFVGHQADGRFANNGWLMELPQPGTRVVWDNPALVSPATAIALGLMPAGVEDDLSDQYTSKKYPAGRLGTITLNGRQMRIAFWVMPGMADNTIGLQYGWGRKVAGLVADGVGFNTFEVTGPDAQRVARGVAVERLAQSYPISSTQQHWTLEGRGSIARSVDLVAWQKHADAAVVNDPDRIYGTDKRLKFGERVSGGELTHAPPNTNIYPHPFSEKSRGATVDPKETAGTLQGRRVEPEPGSEFSKGTQWGMSIDLSTCTGCGACTIACQSENNIPIVGKKEVQKGREMHWIRVDRYFLGEPSAPGEMVHQPVPCMHCENAPCETVCPVNATVHGAEGLNYMTYNRCIGTRYCENNCPYKVRRFNFFDYGVTKFNGSYIGQETVNSIAPDRGGITGSGVHNDVNPNLIPPRLREKLNQIERMQKNPDVTVRSRGVMEKCTYCIQRINESRIELKIRKIFDVPDGFVQTACQQACPTDAIVFGDILDTKGNNGQGSRMHQMREHQRTYMLLGFLNTRPRTTYMVRVSNPNPALRTPVEDPFGHHGDDQGGTHDDGHSAEGGHEPHAGAGMSRSTFLRDGGKKLADKGYALSLRVLNSVI